MFDVLCLNANALKKTKRIIEALRDTVLDCLYAYKALEPLISTPSKRTDAIEFVVLTLMLYLFKFSISLS